MSSTPSDNLNLAIPLNFGDRSAPANDNGVEVAVVVGSCRPLLVTMTGEEGGEGFAPGGLLPVVDGTTPRRGEKGGGVVDKEGTTFQPLVLGLVEDTAEKEFGLCS